MKTATKQSIFRKIFSTGSYGCSGECACGVHHYDSGNHWDDDHKNTLANAEQWAKEQPELVQFHTEAVEYLNFNDKLYVIDCKCKMDALIFDMLNEQKDWVLRYYLETKDAVSVEDVM
tara:strand:- start:462 stop:815 length:354 start_codon:yes stop_codon:yes gene_type:complete